MTTYTRTDIESMNASDRPAVPCLIDGGACNVEGTIIVDGNNPWVTCDANGKRHHGRFSWSAVIDAIEHPERALPLAA